MNQVRVRLDQDHRELNALLLRLSQDASAPSDEAMRATYSELERRLLTHMDAEEQYLVPLVEASHPAQAQCTRSEHEQIRQLLSELGIAVDLHAVRQPAISELIRVLHEHAEREDRTLYRFAGDKASVAVQHRIVTRLKEAAQFAVAAANRAAARWTKRDSDRAAP